MANQAAEIAALQILLVGLYAHVAGKEGSPEKAQALIDNMKIITSDRLEDIRSKDSVNVSSVIDDLLQITNVFFDSIRFSPERKP